MFDLLNSNPAIQDKPTAKALAPTASSLEFDDVSFQYGDGTRVLKNVSFSVPAGHTVALVGATGAQHATFCAAALVTRLCLWE